MMPALISNPACGQCTYLDIAAHALEGGLELIHGDGSAAVGVDALEEALQAVDLVGRQALGHGHQCCLLKLVHGRELAHARDDHAVDGLVGEMLLLQPTAVQDLLGCRPPCWIPIQQAAHTVLHPPDTYH